MCVWKMGVGSLTKRLTQKEPRAHSLGPAGRSEGRAGGPAGAAVPVTELGRFTEGDGRR